MGRNSIFSEEDFEFMRALGKSFWTNVARSFAKTPEGRQYLKDTPENRAIIEEVQAKQLPMVIGNGKH